MGCFFKTNQGQKDYISRKTQERFPDFKTGGDFYRQFIKQNLSDFEVLGFINYYPEVAEADRLGKSVFEAAPQAVADVKKIIKQLEQLAARS